MGDDDYKDISIDRKKIMKPIEIIKQVDGTSLKDEDGDIEIKYIGLRPGEKLYEEVLVDEVRMKPTQFQKVFIASPLHVDINKFSKTLNSLLQAAYKCDERRIIESLEGMEIRYNRT